MENINPRLSPGMIERRSILSFSDKPVEAEKLKLLFEAARWAPSSLNLQPWRFIFATKEESESFNRIFDLLDDGNKRWAHSAPVLALSIAEIVMEYKTRPNRFAFYDLGMAVGNLLIQATAMGLFVHQMGGYNIEQTRIRLGIPERYEPVAILAIGYKGDIEKLPYELQIKESKPRKRREIGDFVFKNHWDNRETWI